MAFLNTHNGRVSQPAGLYILSFSEMWDRFSYYGLQAVLVLYVTRIFVFSDDRAYGIFGAFTSLAFATPVVGGLLADRLLGFRFSIIVGGIFIIIGNALLAFKAQEMMYLGLAVMICGIGLFKPNNVNFTGTLYCENDTRRDAGFSILYMGMNIGALLGPVVYGYIYLHFGWHYGFIISGLGMGLSLLIFCFKFSFQYKEKTSLKSLENKNGILVNSVFLIFTLILILLLDMLMQHTDVLGDLLMVMGIITIIGLAFLSFKLKAGERNRLIALSVLSFFCIFFFACSLQTSSSLTIFIERNVNRDIFGFHLPTVMFASLEPFFIIVTAPIIAKVWNFLASKRKELSVANKVALGLFFASISFMTFSIAAISDNANHMSLIWIIIGNFVLGLGELCIFPVLIAAITKFSPLNFKGTLMGSLFLALSYSGYLAGIIAKLISNKNFMQPEQYKLINYSQAFSDVAIVTCIIAIILVAMNFFLKKLLFLREAEEV